MSEMVAKVDGIGRPAWIALMVLSFFAFPPLGLAVLAFLLWSGRMGCGHRDYGSRWEHKMARWQAKAERWGAAQRFASGFAPTGNRAFDEYRSETLKRLEDEAREFREYLERLRHAKDKAEFDQYMADRKARPEPGPQGPANQGN